MRIVRQRAPERFTVLDNDVLEDRRLSFRAVGVLGFLLSRPDGWETDSDRIARERGHEGRDAVRTALREIEAAGYLARRKVQDAKTGRWSTVSAIIDRPTPENPSSGIRRLENRPSGDRPSESQALTQSTDRNHGHKTPVVTEGDQPPPRTPGDHKAEDVIPEEVRELAAELRTHREAAGYHTARWTPRAVSRAIGAALAAGYTDADIPAALLSIALDPTTKTPGRLAHDGPWWDAAELRRRNAERAELDRQRRVAEQAAAAAAAAEDARLAATCWRCEGTGRTSLDVDGRRISAICAHGQPQSETETA